MSNRGLLRFGASGVSSAFLEDSLLAEDDEAGVLFVEDEDPVDVAGFGVERDLEVEEAGVKLLVSFIMSLDGVEERESPPSLKRIKDYGIICTECYSKFTFSLHF